jgi:hypothetical protein
MFAYPPMHHPTRTTRPLAALVGQIECSKCRRPRANVVSMAFRRFKGHTIHLTVEALCEVCGYQTVYFTEDGK